MAKGKKNCPKCNKEHGAKKRVCECGHEFTKKIVIEKNEIPTGDSKPDKFKRKYDRFGEKEVCPGLWVYDIPKDMPRIVSPGPLKNNATRQEIYEYVAYNGLGDSIFSYITDDNINDSRLRERWKKAKEAMMDVWDYIIEEKI